jgi:hypothetical protein
MKVGPVRERVWAALGVALLTLQAPSELPEHIAVHLRGVTMADGAALRAAVSAAIAEAPAGWGSSAGATVIADAFDVGG